jgi:Right handed beta helix region
MKSVRMGWIVPFAAVIIMGICSSSWAATYYVDFSSGNDANSGLSSATPFKRCPGDSNATSTAFSVALAAGDRVIFKGGVSYKGQININWSGSIDNPIIYDGNTSGTWGLGKAIINNENDRTIKNGFYGTGIRSNIVIDGFDIQNIGGYTDAELIGLNSSICPTGLAAADGTGINFDSVAGSSNIIIRNCYIHEIGEWHNAAYSSASTVAGAGIALQNAKNVVIDGCDITKTKIGISLKVGNYGDKTTDNIEIKNCNIHNHLVWGVDVAPRASGTTIRNVRIHHNKIHDYYEYDSTNWLGCGEKPHTDGIFLRTAGIADSVWTNINIYSNEFYNDWTTGGGTASIYVSQGPSVNIYNNTFVNTLHGRTIAVMYPPATGTSPQVVRIYHNSFYNGSTAINLRDGAGTGRNVYIKNNVFYDTRVLGSSAVIYIEDSGSDPTELDSNAYFTRNTHVPPYVINRAGTLMTFNDIKNYGWEASNIIGIADPRFVNISYGIGLNSSKNNLNLGSSSPYINKGVPLGSYLSDDKMGIVRPSGGGWDIGAYEFTGAVTSTEKIPFFPMINPIQ